MYIYLASAPVFRAMCLGKLGCTEEPYGRRSTYLTGCPPGLTPSQDIDYDAVWETNATTRDGLFDLEDEVHNYFLKYRMMREKPGDSEWFNFQGKNPLDEVKKFMESRLWVKRQVPLSEIASPKRSSRYLRKQYHKNLQYIKNRTTRNVTLNLLQEPVIAEIARFMADTDNRAGYVIAPCGSGKTIISSKGIRGVRKCVICCPSKQIQNQWLATLLSEGIFTKSQIHIVGGAGTTDPSIIRTIFEGDVFCVISTYMSSHLLVDIITAGVELLVLDEAHHMAGIVARDDTGEGRTRRLMLKASDLGVKRLSLTYTPRFIADDGGADSIYLTMDDHSIFGKKIAELKIRDLIRKGVLPDYRLWTLRDEAKKGAGVIGKAECILETWGATEIIRGEEKYILHHLVVFASTTQEAKDLERFFREKTTDTLVLRVGDECEETDKAIAQFTSASRAILVNCFVLNEGVDIPIVNAVAITYPKQSRGQITQMILRAGRWYEGKSVFHVLIPTLGDEDLSGFEEVLSALASCDEQIRDEIVLRTKPDIKPSDPLPPSPETGDMLPECIMIEEFEANQEEIKRCFTNIRKNLFPAKESRRIQELCIEKSVDTSVEYALLRNYIPELPEDPRPKGMLWYDYLHPMRTDRLTGSEFVKTILDPNNVRVGDTYDKWRGVQPTDVIARLPSVQHITDGFFGKEDTNFNTLLEKFGKKVGRGR
jgi:superfamily II DNA or RNA helicase